MKALNCSVRGLFDRNWLEIHA